MADIYLARVTTEANVQRYVVLKRVLAERSRDPQFAQMFLDEARLAAQLQHPNIAQVHDIGTLGGSYFFTMEYVHGQDVRALLQRLSAEHRQLPINLGLFIATGALAALHHAHDRAGSDGRRLEIVHRDVSPANVMVSYEGVVKLLDFGVAKAAQRTTETRTGSIKGKAAYLSPEQCQSAAVDRRSDIFALGIVLYEMLTCRRLFKRDNDFATLMAIVSEPIAPPSSLRPDISDAIDEIVMRALAKDPAARYATASEMLEAIEIAASREHHVLSATAMGRFTRELFGDRREPWIETTLDENTAITVTSGSFSHAIERDDQNQLSIEERLEQAVTLGPAEISEPSLPRPTRPSEIQPPPPATPPTEPTPVPDQPAMVPPIVIAAWPPTIASPGEAWSTPTRSRRALVIALVAVGLIGVGLAAMTLHGGSASNERPSAAAEAGAEATVGWTDAGIAEAAPADAAVVAHAHAADAAIVAPHPPPDAAVALAPPIPKIADAFARADWSLTAQLCKDAKRLTVGERASCGIAACNLKDRAAAGSFAQGAGKSGQAMIDRACRDRGINLPTAPIAPAPKDPCDIDPLRCQR